MVAVVQVVEDGPSISRRSVLGGMAATGLLVGSGLSLTGCTPAPYVPGAEASWAKVDPASVGWDPVRLAEALTFAGERATKAFAILIDGKILAERYWSGGSRTWKRDAASVQKSVSSLLAVIAADRGLLSYDAKVHSYLGTGWSMATATQEAAITVRHLLTMTSGLTEQLAYRRSPGTEWWYNSNAYYCLNKVLAKVSGLSLTDLCHAWLTNPIGGEHNHWAARPGTGGFAIDPKGDPIEGFYTSVLDLARIGLLVQRDGVWNGTRLVSASGLAAATTTSQQLNPSYGQLWWLNGKASYVNPMQQPKTGPIFPGAPPDLVCALGLVDQKVYVSKAHKLVVTRLGDKATDAASGEIGGFDVPLWEKILAAMP